VAILRPMPGPWGPAIARLRLAHGLSKKVVAKRARMTATTYGRIEKGQHTQTRKLQSIAEVFSVDIADVLVLPMGLTQPDNGMMQAIVARVKADLAAQAATAPLDHDQTMRNMHQMARELEGRERERAESDRSDTKNEPASRAKKRQGRKK
jgi:transcriptional regulator with XRE-family HTH domain